MQLTLRCLQIVLARQKESVEFVKSYIDFAKAHGYNAILAYLENAVRTQDTAYFSHEDTYSIDEMKEIVAHAESKGVQIGNAAYIIGGGAKSKVWRQIVADALNLTLVQTETNDSSFGSAMCAGIFAGFFKDFDDASARCQKVVGETKPIPEHTEKYQKIFKKYKKVSQFLVELVNEE